MFARRGVLAPNAVIDSSGGGGGETYLLHSQPVWTWAPWKETDASCVMFSFAAEGQSL